MAVNRNYTASTGGAAGGNGRGSLPSSTQIYLYQLRLRLFTVVTLIAALTLAPGVSANTGVFGIVQCGASTPVSVSGA